LVLQLTTPLASVGRPEFGEKITVTETEYVPARLRFSAPPGAVAPQPFQPDAVFTLEVVVLCVAVPAPEGSVTVQ
jgi:hypothetical protein